MVRVGGKFDGELGVLDVGGDLVGSQGSAAGVVLVRWSGVSTTGDGAGTAGAVLVPAALLRRGSPCSGVWPGTPCATPRPAAGGWRWPA